MSSEKHQDLRAQQEAFSSPDKTASKFSIFIM